MPVCLQSSMDSMISALFGSSKVPKRPKENEIVVSAQPDEPVEIADLEEVDLQEMDQGCQEASTPLRPKKSAVVNGTSKASSGCNVS